METVIREGEKMGEKKLGTSEPTPPQQRALDLTNHQPAARLVRLKLEDLKLSIEPLTDEESLAFNHAIRELRAVSPVTDPLKD